MFRNKPHKKLDLWKKCIDLVVIIYRVTKAFPRGRRIWTEVTIAKSGCFSTLEYFRGPYKKDKKREVAFSEHCPRFIERIRCAN